MITVILSIALVGFLVWLILQIPMPAQFQKIIIAIVCVLLILWLLQFFGVHIPGMPKIGLTHYQVPTPIVNVANDEM